MFLDAEETVWYSVGEAAAIFRRSPATIRRWLRRGELFGSKEQGRWRIDPLSMWLKRSIELSYNARALSAWAAEEALAGCF